jgi:hypothetical protein
LELYVDADDVLQAKRIINAHNELWKSSLPGVFQGSFMQGSWLVLFL